MLTNRSYRPLFINKNKPTLGLVGYGHFGRFILPWLQPYFRISVYDQSEDFRKMVLPDEVQKSATVEEVVNADVVILGVPVQHLQALLKKTAHVVPEGALVLDVSSVKIKPVQLMQQYLHPGCEVVGLHPLFGPQSGKNGIQGLNIVCCPVRTERLVFIRYFLSRVLRLKYLLRTPAEHDREMAYVQALTHFIGRAVSNMNLPDLTQKTPAYQFLLNISHNLGGDSAELFLSIERENPFAKEAREHFLSELNHLKKWIEYP